MSRSKGNEGEERAVRYLQDRGFHIVDRNYTKKGGELDIVARKEGVLRFVEVKSGSGFDPVQNLTPQKLRRVITMAQRYVQNAKWDGPYCIDAMIIRDGEVEFLENITF